MENIEKFANQIIENKNSAESLIIYKNNSDYILNLANDKVFDVRSISKTVLSLACGILIDKTFGEFSLETEIFPIIKDKINLTNKKNLKNLKEVKVKHLLTHTTGYRDLLLFSKDLKESDYDNLFDYCINYPLYYKPGKEFLYSNAGYYLLSATMQEYLGYDLFDFINENLLVPLDIKYRSWGKYGKYLAGATKIKLNAYDMLKIGKLITNEGIFNGRKIIDKSYVELMQKPMEKNTNENQRKFLSEDYYGLGLWVSDKNTIFASGTGGQLIVILKNLDIIIVATNSGSLSKAHKIKEDLDQIIEKIYEIRG